MDVVGGTVTPINTAEVLLPWIGLASVVGIVTVVIAKKRKLDKGCNES